MTKKSKIILGVSLGLLAVVSLLSFTKKGKEIKKNISKLIISDSIISSDTTGATSIKKGSNNQYVEQLQDVLNQIHAAVQYINSNCGSIKWGLFSSGTVPVSGTFDDKTAQMSQFYLNRQEVEIDYLNEIRAKLAKWKQGSKCIYPLSV